MERSILNSFDFNIQNTSNYIVGTDFIYEGVYEYTKNKKFIKIVAYTESTLLETLRIRQSYDPSENTIISENTYIYTPLISNSSNIYLVNITSNFYKIDIMSSDINPSTKRVYNCYLTSDDINVKLYDNSGNSFNSTNNSLNVYNTSTLNFANDSVTAYISDSNGGLISSTSGSLNIYSSVLNDIYTLLNTRGTGILFNSSSSVYSNPISFINKNIKSITIYGNSSGSTTLTLQCSNDGNTWYSSQYTLVLDSPGNFGFGLSGFCPRYLRMLNPPAAPPVIITAYIDYC